MLRFKQCLMLLMVAALIMGTKIASVNAKEIRMVMGGGWAPVSPEFMMMKDFLAPEVNKRLKERGSDVQIDWVFAFGSLVKPSEGLAGCQDGILDVAYVSPPFEQPKLLPLSICYYLPFSSSDPVLVSQTMLRLFERFPALKEFVEKKYNQKVIGNTVMGSYELCTTFPVNKTEDFKGHKIAGAGPNLQWIKVVDAVPVQSSLPEAYTSLQTGVYEGWIMMAAGVAGFKLYEPAKYFTQVHFGSFMGGIITVNLKRWNSLPKEAQDVFMEVGKEYTVKLGEVTKEDDKSDLEKIRKAGGTITILPENEIDKWAARMPNFAKEFAKEVKEKMGMPGADLVKTYYEIQKELGHKWRKDWTQ